MSAITHSLEDLAAKEPLINSMAVLPKGRNRKSIKDFRLIWRCLFRHLPLAIFSIYRQEAENPLDFQVAKGD